MARRKRVQFGTADKVEDHLVEEILAGKKTASVDLAHRYNLPDGDYDDGGYEVGDLVEVYDSRETLRCLIRITEVYEISFGNIPPKLWQAEVCMSAEHFRETHRDCWPGEILTDDSQLIAYHFELVEKAELNPS